MRLHFQLSILFILALCVSIYAATPASTPPATAPATQPLTPEEAVYRSNRSLINTLLDDPSKEDLVRLGASYRGRENYSRAAVYHLIALRSSPDDPRVEYELACDFALWGQKKIGMEYLQKAADHGYWGYGVVKDDTDVDPLKDDPSFPAALAKIQAAFNAESPKHAPGMTLKTPAGNPPSEGWPVLVFLHGFASNRHDFDDEAAFVATLGYVGITLDATEVMGPDAYSWGKTTAPTNDRVQKALKDVKAPLNSKRIYLQGFSQGAMHAARNLADHPDLYAGAICNSPGSIGLIPTKLVDPAHTGTIVLSVGDAEPVTMARGVNTIANLWTAANRPVHIIHFKGGHQLPPDSESMFRTALEQLSAVK